MDREDLVSEHAYPAVDSGGSASFDMLSRFLLALMCATVVFFALLLFPVEFGPFIEVILGWCVAGLAAVLAFIVVAGLIDQFAD